MEENSQGSATPPSLLQRIRDPRNIEAWKSFVEVYGPLVYRHCRGRGLHHEDAENVTQEVFGQISQSIRNFEYRPEVGRFRDWLRTVTRNEINHFLKKDAQAAHGTGGGQGQRLLDDITARGEETAWTEEFNTHLLKTALARVQAHFEEQTWKVFELVWLKKCPAREVAETLQVPIDRVYVAKSRVLERLQKEVRELADDSVLLLR